MASKKGLRKKKKPDVKGIKEKEVKQAKGSKEGRDSKENKDAKDEAFAKKIARLAVTKANAISPLTVKVKEQDKEIRNFGKNVNEEDEPLLSNKFLKNWKKSLKEI